MISSRASFNKQLSHTLLALAVLAVTGRSLPVAGTSQAGANTASALADAKTPAKEDAAAVHLLVFGDSGSGVNQQLRVAREMEAWHKTHPVQAALVLGDIVYPDGNIKTFGDTRYKKPYASLMRQDVRFVVAFGNHDALNKDTEGQLKFYGMPGRYYAAPLQPADLATVFVLDTNTFGKDKAQQQWLNQALGKSKSRWNIVMGHHPLYSSGLHGKDGDIRQLRSVLEPMLVKHGVRLYLAGHDHNYERFSPVSRIQYVVSGGGGAYLRKFLPTPEKHSLVRKSVFHFLGLTVDEKTLQIDAIDDTGKRFDSVTLRR